MSNPLTPFAFWTADPPVSPDVAGGDIAAQRQQTESTGNTFLKQHTFCWGFIARRWFVLTNDDGGSPLLFLQEVVDEGHGARHGQVLEGQSSAMEKLEQNQTVLQSSNFHHLGHREPRQGFTDQDWDQEKENKG